MLPLSAVLEKNERRIAFQNFQINLRLVACKKRDSEMREIIFTINVVIQTCFLTVGAIAFGYSNVIALLVVFGQIDPR